MRMSQISYLVSYRDTTISKYIEWNISRFPLWFPFMDAILIEYLDIILGWYTAIFFAGESPKRWDSFVSHLPATCCWFIWPMFWGTLRKVLWHGWFLQSEWGTTWHNQQLYHDHLKPNARARGSFVWVQLSMWVPSMSRLTHIFYSVAPLVAWVHQVICGHPAAFTPWPPSRI